MYRTASRPLQRVSYDIGDFSEEMCPFETWFKNGYDLTDDSRYNEWLSRYHPEAKIQQSSTEAVQFPELPETRASKL